VSDEGRRRRVRGAALAAASAVLLAGSAAAARAEATAPARELIVPAPGWVRVALDGEALAMIPRRRARGARRRRPGAGLQLRTAPRGTAPIALAATEETRRAGRSSSTPACCPVEYQRLVVTPARETAAAVRVFGSDDRASWTPLGRVSLVRLGDDAGLVRTALDLSPSSFRYLRLDWRGGPASRRWKALRSWCERSRAPTRRRSSPA